MKNKGLAVFWFSHLWVGVGDDRCSFVLPLCPIGSYCDLSLSVCLSLSYFLCYH